MGPVGSSVQSSNLKNVIFCVSGWTSQPSPGTVFSIIPFALPVQATDPPAAVLATCVVGFASDTDE